MPDISHSFCKEGGNVLKKLTTDHRARVTKMLLRKAFLGLLVQKPIQSISIKELCELAGVSRGTFYAHYTDIYDLLAQIEDEMTAEIAAALEPLMDTASADNPVVLGTRIFEVLKNNYDLCTVTLSDNGDKQFAMRLINMGYEKCIDLYRGYFQDVPAKQLDYFYAFISSGVMGLLRKWLDDGMLTSPQEIARLAQNIIQYGIGFFQQAEHTE